MSHPVHSAGPAPLPAAPDFSDLRYTPSTAQARPFAQQISNWCLQWYGPQTPIPVAYKAKWRIWFTLVLIPSGFIFGTIPAAHFYDPDKNSPLPGLVWVTIIAATYCAGLAILSAGGSPYRFQWRAAAFCARNGYRYVPYAPRPNYPGVLFSSSNTNVTVGPRIMSPPGMPYLDISVVNQFNAQWLPIRSRGYLAIQLDRRLPHIILDSRVNDPGVGHMSYSSMGIDISGAREVDMGAPFSNYFRLFCTPGYETDAFYILSPTVMETLIDHATQYDVEIVDNMLFVYAPNSRDLITENSVRSLLTIAQVLGAQARMSTRYYYDSRVPGAAATAYTQPYWAAAHPPRLKTHATLGWVAGAVFFGVIALASLAPLLAR